MATQTLDTKINALATAIAAEFKTRGGYPDYTAGVSKTASFTADADGVVYLYAAAFTYRNAQAALTVKIKGQTVINGYTIGGSSGEIDSDASAFCTFFLHKGDTFAASMSGGGSKQIICTFYPIKTT